ncbi:hypothetical protein BGZ49_007811 [Haplosporangium sp. Z 27]|nr:hypothetical protein BGZ49_007811 [Haplosporangium sp. Z 27]
MWPFCTHLTVTRWEPIVPVTNSSMPSDGENPNIDSTNNGQTHAARLMSLANYIRHILSLTVAVPNAQSQAKARQPQKKDEPRSRNPNMNSDSTTSSGPGPIKSESNRRHRFSPAYHRRNTPHSNDLGYREGSHSTEQQPQSKDYQSQESHPHTPHDVNSVQHSQQPTLAPLLKIPFPNLTLTLALIYVDRLKAKYPEAKGEPGCSQRLFLVAFIIAAKYRCSVDLSPPVPQDLNGEDQDQESMSSNYDDSLNGDESLDDVFNSEAKLEARLNAELIFSNHAWVRLLNLGSFYRQPSATPSATGAITESREQTPQGQSESTHPSLSASSTESQAQGSRPSLSSIMNPATSSPTAGMLQVEDLDRMEAEFLTFLEFDLATMSHDLETCWNLLVGKNETQL